MYMKGKCTEKNEKGHNRIVYWQLIPAGPENPEKLVAAICQKNAKSSPVLENVLFILISLLFAMEGKN